MSWVWRFRGHAYLLTLTSQGILVTQLPIDRGAAFTTVSWYRSWLA